MTLVPATPHKILQRVSEGALGVAWAVAVPLRKMSEWLVALVVTCLLYFHKLLIYSSCWTGRV